MSKPRTSTRKSRNTPKTDADIVQELILSALRKEVAPEDGDTAIEQADHDPHTGEPSVIFSTLRGEHVIHVRTQMIDDVRTNVRLSMMTGYLIMDCPSDALLIGTLLYPTPFHIRTDADLGLYGRLVVGCDITARADDGPLIERRLGELLQLGEDLQWFFPLRLPHHLSWRDLIELEIDWAELPHHDLGGFLDTALQAPPSERTPITLLRLAQGLGRWKDVIRLLKEHPQELPCKQWAPLKALAYRQMERWMPAIRAAKDGGIRNGRYPRSKWLSPSYLHALIMGGDEIEALRLLGEPKCGEPDFYDWLRAIALRQSGDKARATVSFHQYMNVWPGDVLGCSACQDLLPDEE